MKAVVIEANIYISSICINREKMKAVVIEANVYF